MAKEGEKQTGEDGRRLMPSNAFTPLLDRTMFQAEGNIANVMHTSFETGPPRRDC